MRMHELSSPPTPWLAFALILLCQCTQDSAGDGPSGSGGSAAGQMGGDGDGDLGGAGDGDGDGSGDGDGDGGDGDGDGGDGDGGHGDGGDGDGDGDGMSGQPCDAGNLIAEAEAVGGADKKVVVWGLTIRATDGVPDAKLLHAAHVMAQYLDNDEDCVADDPAVLAEMPSTALKMGATEQETEGLNINAQPLWAAEVVLPAQGNNEFDATLEEVLHVVTSHGWARAYPSAFGEQAGSTLADAMDLARGGYFESVPGGGPNYGYPAGSWYHYDDVTCDYECMSTEYIYWAITSLLGGQAGRCNDIDNEWEPCTAALVQSMDPAVYSLLRESGYATPQQLPDGSYTPRM